MHDGNASPIIKTRAMQLVEFRLGEPIDVLLRRCYVEQGMSQDETAKTLGVTRFVVIDWMALFGIPTRDRRKVAAA